MNKDARSIKIWMSFYDLWPLLEEIPSIILCHVLLLSHNCNQNGSSTDGETLFSISFWQYVLSLAGILSKHGNGYCEQYSFLKVETM